MGILSNFFIGDDNLAKSIEDTESIAEEDKFETRNVMDLYVVFLFQISEGKETDFDDDLGFDCINIVGEGEQITTKIPYEFVNVLSNATDKNTIKWAKEWAGQEELMWAEEEAIEFVKELQTLFKKAISNNKSVYLWNCI